MNTKNRALCYSLKNVSDFGCSISLIMMSDLIDGGPHDICLGGKNLIPSPFLPNNWMAYSWTCHLKFVFPI